MQDNKSFFGFCLTKDHNVTKILKSKLKLRGEYVYSEKSFVFWSDMTLTLDIETSFKVTAHFLSKGTLLKENIYDPDTDFFSIKFCCYLNLRSRNFVQGHCTFLTQRDSMDKVWARNKWSRAIRLTDGRANKLDRPNKLAMMF